MGYAKILGLLGISTLLLLTTGCGVESSSEGSGSGRVLTITGFVLTSSNSPQPGATVTCLESGDSAQSGPDGSLQLPTEVPMEVMTLRFLVETDGEEAISEPFAISQDSAALDLNFVLSPTKSEVSVGSRAPTPAPTASPPPPGQLFDEFGNTTAFGIPTGLVGNVGAGRKRWGEQCAACHSRLVGTTLSYNQLRTAIAQPPMNLTLHPANVANLVAYLRFSSR